MSFVVLPSFEVEEANLDAFLAAARADAAQSLANEAGCLQFDVFVDRAAHPTRVMFFEVYADRAAFDAHQTRTRATDWWAATAAIRRDFRIWHEE